MTLPFFRSSVLPWLKPSTLLVTGAIVITLSSALAGDPPRARGKSPGYRDAIKQVEAIAKAKPPSKATGTYTDGGIESAAELPAKGLGYRFAAPARKTHFGTDEMVYGLIELAALIQERRPGSPWLSIGDISAEKGGKLAPHINHQDGCDVDLAFLYCTADGQPADRGWLACDAEGKTKQQAIRFDAARNFEMLDLWMDSPYTGGFEWVFVYDPLKKLIVQHGRDLARKFPKHAAQIEKRTDEIEKVLRQPDSSPHADHFHARVRGRGRTK